MKNKKIMILITIICFIILCAAMFSIVKFSVINPFSSCFGMLQILFTDKEYVVVQKFPYKVVLSKPYANVFNDYMREEGFFEIDQFGAEHIYSNGDTQYSIYIRINRYYRLCVWNKNYNGNLASENIVLGDSTTQNDNNTEKDLTNMAEKTYVKYLELLHFKNSSIGPMPQILVELRLETQENIEKLLANQKTTDSSTYLKSNTKYTDFENEMLKYFSKDFFKENYSQYTNIDGYVGFCNCAGGVIPYTLKNIKFDYQENEKYYFDVTLIDMEMYEHFINPEENENITEENCYFNTKVTFIKENGNLVIEEENYV